MMLKQNIYIHGFDLNEEVIYFKYIHLMNNKIVHYNEKTIPKSVLYMFVM